VSFSSWVNKWIFQLAHVGWGAFLTLFIADHSAGWIGFLCVVGGAAAKEGVFDPLTEDPQTRGSGWKDFGFWVAGAVLGFLSYKIR